MATIKQRLEACGLAESELATMLGPVPNHEAVAAHLGRAGDRGRAALVRLFLLGEQVLAAELPLPPAELEAAGLAERAGDAVRTDLRLTPYEGLLLAHDPEERVREPEYVTGVNNATRTLSTLTIREPVERALDLGTGCGVQALLAARHADAVVAVDVNPCALEYARLNSRLNGIELDVRRGSWFEPVAGETFDLIVANPPFVISPDSSYIFRDSGLAGDAVSRDVVRGAAAHLREGGHATVLCNWICRSREETWQPLAEWVEGSGCDALLLAHEPVEPVRLRRALERAAPRRRQGVPRRGRPLARLLPARGCRRDRDRRGRAAPPRRQRSAARLRPREPGNGPRRKPSAAAVRGARRPARRRRVAARRPLPARARPPARPEPALRARRVHRRRCAHHTRRRHRPSRTDRTDPPAAALHARPTKNAPPRGRRGGRRPRAGGHSPSPIARGRVRRARLDDVPRPSSTQKPRAPVIHDVSSSGLFAGHYWQGSTPVDDAIVRLERLRAMSRDDGLLEAIVSCCLSYVLAMAGRFDEASRALVEASAPIVGAADEFGTAPILWGIPETKELAGDVVGAEQDWIAFWTTLRSEGGQYRSWALRVAAALALLSYASIALAHALGRPRAAGLLQSLPAPRAHQAV